MRRLLYAPSTTVLLPNIFGSGADGDITYSVNTTLSAPINARNVTVNPGVILRLNGFTLFVKGTLLNNGTITAAGYDASADTGGPAGGAEGNGLGKDGAFGRTSVGAGAAGNSRTFGPSVTKGQGGAGGSAAGGAAGAGGTQISGFSAGVFGVSDIVDALNQYINTGTSIVVIEGGAGGGAGGMGTAAVGNSGGGGGGGGVLVISAKYINNTNGTITVAGGVGGNAAGSGNIGGGGGGGGGMIKIVCLTIAQGTLSVAGGAGGTGINSGTNGSAGVAGQSFIISGV